MRTHMREQNYVDRAKLNPARAFKTPMDVVETDAIAPAAKLAILTAWEADERVTIVRLGLTHKEVRYTFHAPEPEMGRPRHLAPPPFNGVPILQHGFFTV